MKRYLPFFVLLLFLLVILFIYHQCQERKRQVQPQVKQEAPVKTPPPDIQEKPPEKIEEKAEIQPPPKEQTKPIVKPALPIPKKDIIYPKKEAETILPQEKIEKPSEKPQAILEERPTDEIAREDLIPLEKKILPPEEKEPRVTEMPIAEVPEEEPIIKEEKIILPPEEVETVKPLKKQPEILPEKTPVDIKKTIALLPFNNFTPHQNALEEVLPLIASRLEEKGFYVVTEKKTAAFLCRERNRNITSLTQAQAKKAGKLLQAGFILAGAVISYSHNDNPAIGISARLISAESGHIVWADYASETGDDFTKLFGLGRINNIDNLIPKVIDELLASFDTTQQLNPEESYKIAVLPFKNLSDNTDAGMIVTYLFLTELYKNRLFEPIEYGNVWNNMVKTRVRQRGELTHKNIEALSESLGINTLLVGTVENYTDGTAGARPPNVSISARLLDARNNKILWFNSLELDGDDKIIVSDLGKMRSADKVAHIAVSDLVKNMVKAKWQ